MEQTNPIIDYYKKQGKLYEVDSSMPPLEVFEQIKRVIGK
jgi:adenylate kinase family enzyme